MCSKCNYPKMLRNSDLEPTTHRLWVLEIIGQNTAPLSADDIYSTIVRHESINRVTVYRVLKLLTEKHLLEQFSCGRSSYYGLAPNENHPPHAHFICRICEKIDCLNPESLAVDALNLEKTFSGQIDKLDIRVEGICRHCLKQMSETD